MKSIIRAILILAILFNNCYLQDPQEVVYPAIQSGAVNVISSSEFDPAHGIERFSFAITEVRDGADAWLAASNNLDQWVILASPVLKKWHRLETKGRGNCCNSFVTKYKVEYTVDGINWEEIKEFTANSSKNDVKSNVLEVVALAIKIKPTAWNEHIAIQGEAYISDVDQKVENKNQQIPAIASGIAKVSGSSVHNPSHGFNRIKLGFKDYREGSRSWCSSDLTQNHYITVGTGIPQKWTSITMSPRYEGNMRVTSFYVEYTVDGKTWGSVNNGEIFNSDVNNDLNFRFKPEVVALAVRVRILGWRDYICAHMEVFFKHL